MKKPLHSDFVSKSKMSFDYMKNTAIEAIDISTVAKQNPYEFDYDKAIAILGGFNESVEIYLRYCEGVLETDYLENGVVYFDELYMLIENYDKLIKRHNDTALIDDRDSLYIVEIVNDIIPLLTEMSTWYD